MEKLKKVIMFLIVCFALMIVLSLAEDVSASESLLPAAQDNLSVSLRSTSELTSTENGYMRVYYTGKKIGIEYYDNDFNITGKKSIEMELNIWGGFYAGSDAYYIVEGQNNTDENDMAEVVRIIKYDMNWNRIGAASITGNTQLYGGEVRYPFDCGCVEMTEYNKTLYIVTGHEGYVDPNYNQGHQGFLMIAVDENTMTGSIVDCDLWHSFAQYIDCRDSNMYVLEQSEGSRYTKLSEYNMNNSAVMSIPVLKYGGISDSAWAIPCYASVDGMALSSDNVLCIGTSIDQSAYESINSNVPHNIYITVTPMSNFSEDATTVKWLTDFKGDGKCFYGVNITKVSDNRFIVLWEENAEQTASIDDGLSSSILHYVFIDGNGDKISEEFTAAAPISDCHPIIKDSKIVYYASNSNMVDFYTIDAQTGQFNKKIYRIAGENAVWECNDGVLTISGIGAINGNAESKTRIPRSSTASGIISYSSDNAWKYIRADVKKIVIKTGITSIPEREFAYFNNLSEVEIEPGLISIGKEAFYSCESLKKITIPASVTSIGEDILWTGYYSIVSNRHIVNASIYTLDNSYAAKYAREKGITCNGVNLLNNKNNNEDYSVNWENSKGKTNVVKKATLLKLTSPKAKKIKVKWKKISNVKGYEIQYARNAKFTKGMKKLTVKKKATSKTISKLVRHKKYYVRVRAFYNSDGKRYYGDWSKTRSIKCK